MTNTPSGDSVRLDRIVVGTDFSDPSTAALRWAADFFAPEAELILVHALELPLHPETRGGETEAQTEIRIEAEAAARASLREIANGFGDRPIRLEVRAGPAPEIIQEVAAEYAPDLIVVGTHGKHGPLQAALGSTAERLAHQNPIPVLLVTSPPAGPPCHILASVDDSPSDPVVLEWAKFLQSLCSTRISALAAMDPKMLGRVRLISSASTTNELAAKALEGTKLWLDELVVTHGLTSDMVTTTAVRAEEAEEILDLVRQGGVDLVILGGAEHGVAGWLLGSSVADVVLRHSKAPVLVVAAP